MEDWILDKDRDWKTGKYWAYFKYVGFGVISSDYICYKIKGDQINTRKDLEECGDRILFIKKRESGIYWPTFLDEFRKLDYPCSELLDALFSINMVVI